jgi:hypothetical protein
MKYKTMQFVTNIVVKIPIPNNESDRKRNEKSAATSLKESINDMKIYVDGLFEDAKSGDDWDVYVANCACGSVRKVK